MRHHLKTRWFIVLALCAVRAAVAADDDQGPSAIDLARLDGFAQGLTEGEQFSGVVLVARRGHVLFEHAYGKRDETNDAKQDDAATVDTRYNLASAGKMFTSVAIWQQIAAGRLTLDTTVGSVLADYPNKAFAAKATVRQLLTHTSGAGEADLFGVENVGNRECLRTTAAMVAAFGVRPPSFEPGSGQDYSNFGYLVLGRMVEVLSGETYEDYVAHHVFVPAGMMHTDFAPCATRAADLAVGYAMVDGQRQSNCATQPLKGSPAGGTVSTVGDLLRFIDAVQSGKLMRVDEFVDAIKPYRQFMGLGFFATDYGPNHALRDFRWGHGGSSDGACTDVRTYPVTGETIIVLSNREAPACFLVSGFLHRQYRPVE